MQRIGFRRQRGIVMPLFVVAMVGLVGMAGLALDMGQAYLAKTRVQNALDAAALSGAKTLKVAAGNTGEAAADAMEAFNFHAGATDLGGTAPTVEFSPTLQPFAPSGANARYVRVRLAGMPVATTLTRALPGIGDALNVGGSAVAGPIEGLTIEPDDEICNLVPLVIGMEPGSDTDCTDGSCFGYQVGDEIQLKYGAGNNNSGDTPGPGNFNLIELGCGSGANCVRQELAGSFTGCLSLGDTVTTEPGNKVGPAAQGINTRFGDYRGPVSQGDYPPDTVTRERIDFATYENLQNGGSFDFAPPAGVPRRRMMTVVFADFSDQQGGSHSLTTGGFGCFFLTRKLPQGGHQSLYGELVADCNPEGPSVPEDPPVGSGGFFKIILYKDPDGTNS